MLKCYLTQYIRTCPQSIRRVLRFIGLIVSMQIIWMIGQGIFLIWTSKSISAVAIFAAGWVLLILGLGSLATILFYPILAWIWTGHFKNINLFSDTRDWTTSAIIGGVFSCFIGLGLLSSQGYCKGVVIWWLSIFSRLIDLL